MKRKHRKQIPYKWSYPYRHSFIGGWKKRALFEKVSKFLIFIGYPRSGHSLIGSLLDAHPNIVISNQLDALSLFIHNYSKKQIYFLIWENAYRAGNKGRSNSNYDYQVPSQWQGKSKEILIIGDKRGGKSSKLLANPLHADLLGKISKTTKVPLKMVHVIRNPFDNISTMISRATRDNKRTYSEALFEEKFNLYFNKVEVNAALLKNRPTQIHSVHLEQFINAPAEQLALICEFIGIDAQADYLNDCASIIWSKPNQSRFKADFWTDEKIQLVQEKKEAYDFLKGYTY